VADETGVSRTHVTRMVNLLRPAGAVTATRGGPLWNPTTTVDDAIDAAAGVAAQRRRIGLTRVEMMRGYADTLGCRPQFLLGYFGADPSRPCGFCDTCAAGSAHNEVPAGRTGFPVQSRVRHIEWATAS
jgi:ATP-dependent DNA helicase RecQ